MRRCSALVLLVALSWLGGLAQDARAGVTFDVVFRDGTGAALTIPHGDPGPGCEFGGYYGGGVSTGHCMDVIITSTYEMLGLGTSVTYDSDNGLAVASLYEWQGVGVSFNKSGEAVNSCTPPIGLTDWGGIVSQFVCITAPPFDAGVPAGTYNIGTIIWDTSGTTHGTETIAAFIDTLIDGVIAVIDGNVVDVSSSVEVGSAVLHLSPEPGTAALLGLGLVGLVIASRSRRPPAR